MHSSWYWRRRIAGIAGSGAVEESDAVVVNRRAEVKHASRRVDLRMLNKLGKACGITS